MKIGIYIGNTHPESGGAYTFQKDILDSLKNFKDQHEYYVLTEFPEEFENNTAIKAISIKLNNRQKLYFKLLSYIGHLQTVLLRRKVKKETNLMRLMKKHSIDIAWFMSSTFENPGVPYIFTVWDLAHKYFPFLPEITTEGWQFDEREEFFSEALAKAALIITGTSIGKRDIINSYNIPSERISIIPFSTPQYTLDNLNSDKGAPFFTAAKDYIFYPAQYWPHKNHLVVLRALKFLKENFDKTVHAVFTGSDKGNLAYIKQRAIELGVEKQVHFLGFVSRDQLINLYKHAKMLVFPTYFGPDNLPPLEAFSLGCPVVASNIPGASEQLGSNALFFNPQNEAELANCILSVLNDSSLRSNLIIQGIKRAKSWTSLNYTDKVLKSIDDLKYLMRLWKHVDKSNIKVLHINTNDVLGGAAQQAYELTHRLNVDCTMVVQIKESTSPKVIEFRKNILDKSFIVLDKFLWKIGIKKAIKNLFSISNQFNYTFSKLKKLKAYRDADIIHIHNIHGNYFDLSALGKIAKEKHIVWTLHDMWAITGGEAHTFDNENYKKGIAKTSYNDIYPLKDMIIDRRQYFMNYKKKLYEQTGNRITFVPVSYWLEQCVLSSYVYNSKIKVRMIHNAVDRGIFRNLNNRSWTKPRILFFNISNPFKGIHQFTEIINSIKGSFDLYIVGEPLADYKPVKLFPYIIDRDRLNALFNEVDILIFPSIAESLGMTVLEAMAAGVCVIASDVGGIPDMLDNDNGYLFNSGNSADLLEKINSALADIDGCRKKGSRAAGDIESFSLENNCQHYMDLYNEILGRSNTTNTSSKTLSTSAKEYLIV